MSATHIEQIDTPKDQIIGEPEIKNLFGMEKDDHSVNATVARPGPDGLPVVEAEYSVLTSGHGSHGEAIPEHADSAGHEPAGNRGTIRLVVPYVLVFALGVFLYYFYFTDFSFTQIFKSVPKIERPNAKVAKAMEAAMKEKKADYGSWMNQFYFQVKDDKIIDPNEQNCQCGLTNFEKYLLNLNPKVYDTRGNGTSDGMMILQGIDPATGEPLAGNRKKIVEAYFDTELISDRLGVEDVTPVAGSNEVIGARNSNAEAAGRGGSSTNISGSREPQISATSTIAIDSKIPAQLEIPGIVVKVPIIFSKTTKDFDHDLTLGAVHYPGTVYPGEIGNAYVSAHSSALPWVQSQYKTIFARFGELKEGDTFTITMTLDSGKTVKLDYVIRNKGIYDAEDQAQFVNTAKSTVSLSTCWPIGTAKQRYVVRGELVKFTQQ